MVYFAVPLEKCDASDLARLYHLGFSVPFTLYATRHPPWPYVVAICTSRRSQTIANDTLSTLLADQSVPPDAVVLCVRDAEDAQMYSQFGFRMLVAEEGKGLPEQRQICLRCQPTGAWY